MAAVAGDAIDELFYPGSKRKRKEPVPVPVEEPWQDAYTEKWVKGRPVQVYTVGALAKALGVSVQTVRAWERDSRIPLPPYRLPDNMIVAGENKPGRRLYTKGHIDAVVSVMEAHDLLGKSRVIWRKHPGVTEEIIDTYQKARRRNPDAY